FLGKDLAAGAVPADCQPVTAQDVAGFFGDKAVVRLMGATAAMPHVDVLLGVFIADAVETVEQATVMGEPAAGSLGHYPLPGGVVYVVEHLVRLLAGLGIERRAHVSQHRPVTNQQFG